MIENDWMIEKTLATVLIFDHVRKANPRPLDAHRAHLAWPAREERGGHLNLRMSKLMFKFKGPGYELQLSRSGRKPQNPSSRSSSGPGVSP